jgi:hypothetical protein
VEERTSGRSSEKGRPGTNSGLLRAPDAMAGSDWRVWRRCLRMRMAGGKRDADMSSKRMCGW